MNIRYTRKMARVRGTMSTKRSPKWNSHACSIVRAGEIVSVREICGEWVCTDKGFLPISVLIM